MTDHELTPEDLALLRAVIEDPDLFDALVDDSVVPVLDPAEIEAGWARIAPRVQSMSAPRAAAAPVAANNADFLEVDILLARRAAAASGRPRALLPCVVSFAFGDGRSADVHLVAAECTDAFSHTYWKRVWTGVPVEAGSAVRLTIRFDDGELRTVLLPDDAEQELVVPVSLTALGDPVIVIASLEDGPT